MKIAVTGFKGHVGKALISRHGVKPLDCNIESEAEVRECIDDVRPDIIINAASKTKPDWCEKKENAKEVIATNVRGVYNVCNIANEKKIPIIVLSTDHIFDGKHGPYKEDARGKYMKPVNYYGASKLGSETIAFMFPLAKVVRTSNLFWSKDPRVTWYTNSLVPVDVPTFQYRSFMHIHHFADVMMEYISKFDDMPVVLNLSGSETMDWLTFVKAFAEAKGRPTDTFLPKKVDEKHFVPRPQKAGLDTSLSSKLGITQYSYKDGLEEMKNE